MARKLHTEATPVTPPEDRPLDKTVDIAEALVTPDPAAEQIRAALETPAPVAKVEPVKPKYENIDEYYAAEPEEANKRVRGWYEKLDPIEKSVVDKYMAVQANFEQLNKTFEPLQPLIEYATERNADGSLKNLEALKRLNDPTYREYALIDAARVWEAHRAPGEPGAGQPGSAASAEMRGADPALVDRLAVLENKVSTDELRGRAQSHDQYRAQEVQALAREVPGLRYWDDQGEITNQSAYNRMKMIAEYARNKSFNPDGTYNYEKPYSLKKAYEQFKVWEADTKATPDLPIVAQTSSPGVPVKAKSKDPAKRKQAAIDKIDSLGGFGKVAAALDKRG